MSKLLLEQILLVLQQLNKAGREKYNYTKHTVQIRLFQN